MTTITEVAASYPALPAAERAFRVQYGATGDGTPKTLDVAIGATRMDSRGEWLPVRISARALNADGTTAELKGAPLQIPDWVHSIYVGGLVAGTATVETEVSTQVLAAVDRMVKHLVVLDAFFRLPGEPEEAAS